MLILTFNYHGLASIELEFHVKILLDPGVSETEDFELLAIVEPDFILVSCTLPEHMGRVNEIASRSDAVVVSNENVIATLQEAGSDIQMHSIGHNESIDLGKKVTVSACEQHYDSEPVDVNTIFYVTSERASVLHLGHARDLRGLADCHPNLLGIPINGMEAGIFTPQSAAETTARLAPDYVLPLLGDISKITEFVLAVGATKTKTKTLYPAEGESYTVPIYRRE